MRAQITTQIEFQKGITMQDKINIIEKKNKLIEMTTVFCAAHLDEEYKHLCERFIEKMSRKRNVPFLSGRLEIWASAVVYALGSINFLFDRSSKPYLTADDICNHFGTSKSTTQQKAKFIRDTFKLDYWNNEFSTQRMQDSNPFSNFIMVNGFIVNKKSLSDEIQ